MSTKEKLKITPGNRYRTRGGDIAHVKEWCYYPGLRGTVHSNVAPPKEVGWDPLGSTFPRDLYGYDIIGLVE